MNPTPAVQLTPAAIAYLVRNAHLLRTYGVRVEPRLQVEVVRAA